ncbi:flagellar biosynthesis anti-sigma factor FlgM [Granulicella sp. S190]|uniref:flagellar biosynthesis anti-sigma factor FlgM n=1 Tax=Granulicella sp. S190 TaxID=1747226 RepID=UPI00131C72AE|nr:flagellar biosynthesis anti-sigma factor FlgM [Granulicella sp. S190]
MSYASGIGGQETANGIALSETHAVVPANISGAVANKDDKDNGSSTAVGHSDETALSSAGGFVFQSLETSDTRTAKVSSLQEAIAAGSYSVSSSDVADRIFETLLK